MTCYSPIKAYRSTEGKSASGKWPIVFNIKEGYRDLEIEVPCNKCIGCRIERSKQWALRCIHEARLHQKNCFITLSYNDYHLPKDLSLDKTHFQKFMKRLRKKYGDGIRYYQCGEYGEKNGRPHYHACIFNHDFSDKYLWSVKNGVKLYRSESLDKIWGKGFATVGDVTYESAAYVARYIMKKVLGDGAAEYYNGKEPEYTTMSRRPGIGKKFYEKYKDNIYSHDEVVRPGGKKFKPPKFYDNLLEIEDQNKLHKIKVKRKKGGQDNKASLSRLRQMERIQERRAKRLIRSIEQ